MQWLFDRFQWFPTGFQPLEGRIPQPMVRWNRECYIPFHTYDLIDNLCDPSTRTQSEGCQSADAMDWVAFRSLAQALSDRIQHRYRDRYTELLYRYSLVDPDRDEIHLSDATDNEETSRHVRQLLDDTEELLLHANYHRLSPKQIQEAIQTASHWGLRLRVRLSMFRRLQVYARGDIISKRSRRVWYKWFRMEEVEVPLYQRLVVVFRPKDVPTSADALDPNRLHLRMFKNVPKADLDMLLPGAGVRISWLDKGRIGIPTAWGFVMLVSKLVKNIWLVAILSALKIFTSIALIVAVVIASIFYVIKSFFSYRTAKRRYLLSVTQSLYYQILDNNMGVVLRLIEEARHQEACEAIIAYYGIATASESECRSHDAIDARCEAILDGLGAGGIDFDFNDAIRELIGLGVVRVTNDGLVATPIDEALRLLKM